VLGPSLPTVGPLPDPPRGDRPSPPSSRWPFRWAAYALAVTAFGAGLPTPLYPIYQREFQISPVVLTAIFAAYTLGVLATMLLVAPLSDVLGRKPVLYLGMVLTAASAIAFLTASGSATLAVARVVSGLAVGATTSTATAAMASLEPRQDQHHVARVSVAANFGAVATGIVVSGLLAEYAPAPTRLAYVVLVLASAVGVAAVARLPETVGHAPQKVGLRRQHVRVPGEIRRPFWVAAGALAGCYALYGFFGALAPSFLREALDLRAPSAEAGVVATLFGLAAIVQLGLGQLRDRRALLLGLPLMLAALAGLVLSVAFASLDLLIVSAAALGVGVGLVYMGSVTLIDRVAPAPLRGEVLSAFFVVGYLALAVPTIGVGLVAYRFGLSAAALVLGLALGVFTAALYAITRDTPTPPGGEGRPRGGA
jgi:MFS family permease